MSERWVAIWWFPFLQRRTGWHKLTPFVHSYGTRYRWRPWFEVVLEQSEDMHGNWAQTIRLPNGEEIVRKVPQSRAAVGSLKEEKTNGNI